MREFFQGWRRKTGLALLAMALVLTVAWFRSFVGGDRILWSVIGHVFEIDSKRGKLGVIRARGQASINSFAWTQATPRLSMSGSALDAQVIRFSNERWRSGDFEFTSGEALDSQLTNQLSFVLIQFPYTAIVLPLTLLSAWLILSKRRPARSAKSS